MKTLLIIPLTLSIFFSGCSTTNVAKSPIGAAVIAKTSNIVIDKQLHAAATKLDTGNPYLHSLAVGLRAVEGQILTAEDIKKIAADYGDPHNQHKFKSLALNLWNVIKPAAINIGWAAATELAAVGLQQGAVAGGNQKEILAVGYVENPDYPAFDKWMERVRQVAPRFQLKLNPGAEDEEEFFYLYGWQTEDRSPEAAVRLAKRVWSK